MDKLQRVQAGLSVIGLIISIYLTVYHYVSLPLYCPATGIVDCGVVLNSSYAVIAFDLPSSILGVAFFIIELLLILYKKDELNLYWNVIGLFTVFYFWYAEYTLQRICLYCTVIHVIVIALLYLSVIISKRK